MPVFRRLIDEAVELDVREVFITGGEPFLLPDIGERLRYAAGRLRTTVLTNGMLFSSGRRYELVTQLAAEQLDLRFQISLDGATPEVHDVYRGAGAWQKATDGIHLLQSLGLTVTIGSTETAANTAVIDELNRYVSEVLGIASEDHFVRPLARRGYSDAGMEVSAAALEPELTVSLDGIFWHPLACEDDLLVTRRLFPLREAFDQLQCMYDAVLATGAVPQKFR